MRVGVSQSAVKYFFISRRLDEAQDRLEDLRRGVSGMVDLLGGWHQVNLKLLMEGARNTLQH